MLRDAGLPVVAGRLAGERGRRRRRRRELGGPVALKLCAPGLRHKSERGGVLLGLHGARRGPRRLRAAAGARPRAPAVLVEAMAPAGAELLLAARADGLVPALLVGLRAGSGPRRSTTSRVVPLPATPARVERALLSLRAAPLLLGARGRDAVDLAAVARVACTLGALLLAAACPCSSATPSSPSRTAP